MTADTRTPEEIAYDAERDGTLYAPPAGLSDQIAAVFRDKTLSMEEVGRRCAELAIAATPKRPELPPYEPFGALSDGSPIEGHTDDADPTGRNGVVSANLESFGDYRLTAQDTPNLIDVQGDGFLIEGATLAELHTLRDLLSTDLPEQVLRAAVAYGRCDTAPPCWAMATPTPPTPPIVDLTTMIPDRVNGTPIDLVVMIEIGAAIERNKAQLGISQKQVYAITHHVADVVGQYLVSPARRAQCDADDGEDEAPTPPAASAVVIERWTCDDDLDPRCGQELGTDFRSGEVLIYLPDDGSTPMLRAFDTDFSPKVLDRDLDNLIALLSDPRVQAARRKAA
jgi:hypothetical protein